MLNISLNCNSASYCSMHFASCGSGGWQSTGSLSVEVGHLSKYLMLRNENKKQLLLDVSNCQFYCFTLKLQQCLNSVFYIKGLTI